MIFIRGMAQPDFDWWNEAHNWDGITSWTNYIVNSSYYMGPNALPVPESQKGLIRDKAEFKSEYAYHFSKGDKTHNIQMYLYYPVVKNVIAVEFYGVPYESFKMDYETIISRRTRYLDGSGTAIGDFYFSTIIQILKKQALPEVAFRMACRTASGSDLGNARFTDAPGYFFDLSIGKDIIVKKNPNHKIRFHGMLGFYSWQMNLPNHQQNDAILYGIGADLQVDTWNINLSLDGYVGYFGDELVIVGNPEGPVPFRDRPMVLRFETGKKFGRFKLFAGYQSGLHDFVYRSVKAGLTYHF